MQNRLLGKTAFTAIAKAFVDCRRTNSRNREGSEISIVRRVILAGKLNNAVAAG
jgi:hypothetical protein